MTSSTSTNGWPEYQRLVMAELKTHGEELKSLTTKIGEIRETDLAKISVQIAMLKLRASMWGGISGAVPGAIAVAISLLGR